MAKGDFLKIIYFDESFVADFMQIIEGGELKKTSEFLTAVESEVSGDADIKGSMGTNTNSFTKIFSFLTGASLAADASVDLNISRKTERMAKNILENTLLSDFISLLESDKRRTKNKRCTGIEVFEHVSVRPEADSFSFYMLVAPFLGMVNGELPVDGARGQSIKLDISKMEQAIEKGRGYYEFVAKIGCKDTILRFNRLAFRNSYTMSDLPKMQLTYYAIRVGKIDKRDLHVQKEFEFGTSKPSERIDYAAIKENLNDENTLMDVYDVVLGGIVEE